MITLCVPTRGRPERAKLMLDSALATAQHPDKIEILFYLNLDDPTVPQYKKLIPHKYISSIGPHQSTCMSWNQLAYKAKNEIVVLMGDDVLFKTQNWDKEIKHEFDKVPDQLLMVVPYTGRPRGYTKNQKLAVNSYVVSPNEKLNAPHYAVSKDWIKLFGYLCSPMFWHFYVDTYAQTVASRVGRCIYKPSITWRTKKLEDVTTQEVRDHLNIRDRDSWVWDNCKRQLDADVQHLKNSINFGKKN